MSKRRPSGDGMVRKKDDGRWEGRIVIGHKENGDSIFRYIYAPTQKELTAKLRQEIIAYQGVDLTEDSKITLSEWLDYWLDAIMAGTIRPSTLNGYRRYADLYIKPYLGDKQISKITPADVQKMYEVLKARGACQGTRSIRSPAIRQHGTQHPHHVPRSHESGEGIPYHCQKSHREYPGFKSESQTQADPE